MTKVLVVYASRTGETQSIADYIAEGVRFTGAEAKVVEAAQLKKEEDLEGYDAYVFGSATYHGDMMPAVKTLLFLAEKAGVGKQGRRFFRCVRMERRGPGKNI